jgi:hypothetical protein
MTLPVGFIKEGHARLEVYLNGRQETNCQEKEAKEKDGTNRLS